MVTAQEHAYNQLNHCCNDCIHSRLLADIYTQTIISACSKDGLTIVKSTCLDYTAENNMLIGNMDKIDTVRTNTELKP